MHELRTRSAGLTKFIQLHIVLDPTMPLGNAHVVGDRIEAMLREAFPQAEIILHVDGWDDANCAGPRPDHEPAARLRRRGPVGDHRLPRKRIWRRRSASTRTAPWSSSPGERAYKLKRAVKFPYMDFSTVERRAAMCAAEIEINRQLAPEIYLGTAPVRRGRDGKLALGDVGETAATPSTGWSSCAASTRTACSTAWPSAAR